MAEYKSANNDYSEYEKNIETMLANENLDFLKNWKITSIFGVSKEFGMMYLTSIKEEFPDFIDDVMNGKYDDFFSLFHSIGQPDLFFSEIINRNMNANTARYIYHALLIRKYINRRLSNTKLQIVEIGGGYGGLCFWLSKLIPECIHSYEIVDLEIVSRLQNRCLDKWGINCSYLNDPLQWKKSEYPVFCISNYGYSEFNKTYQDLYKETILNKTTGGFMVWNNWTGIYKFTENEIKIEKERPSFPGICNTFLYF